MRKQYLEGRKIIKNSTIREIFGSIVVHKQVCQIKQSFLEFIPLKFFFQMSKIEKNTILHHLGNV